MGASVDVCVAAAAHEGAASTAASAAGAGASTTGSSFATGWNDGAAGLFSVSRQEIGGFLEALC